MATRYVDPAASGANNGTSWTDAFLTLIQAAAVWNPGDLILCRGTETLSATMDNYRAGSTSARVTVRGVDASGNNTGVQYHMDASGLGVASDGMYAGAANVTWENIKVTGAPAKGMSDASGNSWLNCEFSSNGTDGAYAVRSSFIQCKFNSNTNDGFIDDSGTINSLLYCEIKDNSGDGITTSANSNLFMDGCLVHNNTVGINFGGVDSPYAIVNSIIDGNSSHGISGAMTRTVLTGNRFTNNGGWAVYNSSADGVLTEGFNAFYGNSSGEISISGSVFNVGTDTSMSGAGYTDQPNDDFTYAAGAEATNQTVYIGTSVATTNLCGVTAGPPMPATATPATPTFAGITRLECLSDGSLLAKCAEITDTHTSYNLYIKPTNATGLFADTYKVKVLTPTIASSVASILIRTEADMSTYLTDGTEYFVGIRAENDGSEDTNTVSLSQKSLGISVPRRLPISVEVI